MKSINKYFHIMAAYLSKNKPMVTNLIVFLIGFVLNGAINVPWIRTAGQMMLAAAYGMALIVIIHYRGLDKR